MWEEVFCLQHAQEMSNEPNQIKLSQKLLLIAKGKDYKNLYLLQQILVKEV